MTDPTKCPRCGRPDHRGEYEGMAWCISRDSHSCQIVRDGYLRGLRAGVDLAKDHDRGVPMEWADVDAELARREGDG